MKQKLMQRMLMPALLLLILSFGTRAQTIEEIQKKYPGKTAVFSNLSRNVDISFNEGILSSKATEVSDMLILDDKANGIYNKDKVFNSSFNELIKLDAYTFVVDGNDKKKIKVSDFKTQSSISGSVFYDDVKETVFDYPKLLKGSLAHLETEHFNKDVRFITPFYFSTYLPVLNASYSITFPEDVEVKYIIKNDDNNNITVTETKKGRKKKLEFTASGISSNEYFGDGVATSYYAEHVIVYVSKYKDNKTVVPVFGSVEELYKWNSDFLKNINNTPNALIKQISDSICAPYKTEREKTQAIYLWVQNHIKYVAFEEGLEGFVPRQAADVCNKRYGDCKDMASLLTALLKANGMKAYFTWIGTRSIPYTYTEVPLPITDNHMISSVNINNEWIFLDATDPNCIFGFPSDGIQDKQALIAISPDKYELIKVPIVPANKNIVVDSTFLNFENKLMKGYSSVDYLGYFGTDVYNSLMYNKGDDERVYARRRMAKGSNKFIMKDYAISFPDSIKKEANIKSHFEIPDYAKFIDDEIYINLNLEKLFSNPTIDTAKRKVAIENDFLQSIRQVHVLNIPDGYVIGYLPQNIAVSNDLIDYSIEYKQLPGKVIATQNYVTKKLYIQPQDFTIWNNAIKKISPAYKEEVVLKKK